MDVLSLSLTDRIGPPAILTAGTIVTWLYRGDFHVEAILPIIVQIVTGVLGGQAVGAVLQQVAMSQLTKIISGAVGGVAGGTLLGSLLGGASVLILLRAGHWVAFSATRLAARAVARSLPRSSVPL